MRPDVIINDVSMDSLGWLRESIDFPAVQSQASTITVPGRNSPVRFDRMNGKICYKPRTFSIVLVMYGERKKFMNMVSHAEASLAGVLSKVITGSSKNRVESVEK